ncbi:MAG: tRNA uridine-5-carboxymethylaminomethyl(34) synthesis GTPase MnmE [Pseudomonadota bacterium]
MSAGAGTDIGAGEVDDTNVADGDTIAAVATAPGQAGIGVVRVSGPAAGAIAQTLTGHAPAPRTIRLRRFLDSSGETIDSGLVLYFQGPASFTGEDVVEFQGHGGHMVLQMVLDAAMAAGARMARPGEFTERAYLNGKLDLAQAEAVADLIASGSEAAVRGANRSLSGAFSSRVTEIDALVLELRVFVEAAIDFPDEDIDLLADGQVAERIDGIIDALTHLEADCAQGVLLRDGIKLAIVGAPNVGKSSLLNQLSGESRAIVTDIPGTTRDLVAAEIDIDGLRLEIVDTAGLRETDDTVEAEGVRRALAEAAEADVVLYLQTWGEDQTDRSVNPYSLPLERVLGVWNKVDLAKDLEAVAAARDAGQILVSATTGEAFTELRAAIRDRVGYSPSSNLFTARKRHLIALATALEAVRTARLQAADTLPGELIAEELKAAHAALGEIVGELTSDALLGEIFSTFCIGK